jgi:hypothetical protein
MNLDQIGQFVQSISTALNAILTVLKNSFPSATGTSASATGGSATLPSQPVGFLVTTLPGTTTVVKVPYYT